MFDEILAQSPYVKQREKQATKQAEEKTEIRTLREVILSFVELRFPALKVLAKSRIAKISQPEWLRGLINQLMLAPDEATVRQVLEAGVTS